MTKCYYCDEPAVGIQWREKSTPEGTHRDCPLPVCREHLTIFGPATPPVRQSYWQTATFAFIREHAPELRGLLIGIEEGAAADGQVLA